MQGDLPATISEGKSGKPALPSEPFPSAGELREYCGQMTAADSKRAHWRSEVDGLINGNRPINQAALREKKLGWFPNVNYREAEGYINAPQTAFYDLVTEADPCIEVYLDYGKGQDSVDWEESIAKHWTWLMLRRWRMGFNYHVPMCQREMLVHGLGAHVWTQMHTNNWIEQTPRAGHILFPEDCPSNFEDEGECFVLRERIPLHILYRWIKNEAAAQRLGWMPDMVWKAMAITSKSYKETNRGDNVEAWKRQQKRGDLGGSITRQSGVWVNWAFAREIETGEISLYATAEKAEVGGYLFKKRFLYDTWPLALFPYETSSGDSIHSIRGLGARAKDFFELSNRIKNTMAAQVILSATVPLQQTGNIDTTKLKLLKLGMMSIIPQNLQIAQGFRFPDLSQGPLALDRELRETLRQNTESYVSGTPEPRDRETATSFQMRAQDSAQVSKGVHGLYGSHLCNYWDKKLGMVVKAAKMSGNKPYIVMAKEFVARCVKDGVPAEAFDHICEVRELLSTGAGSAAARLQQLLMLFQYVFPNTTEDRKINILRDISAAMVNGAKVDRYAPSLHDNDVKDSEDSIIALENDALMRGGQAVVAPRQNQVRHAQGHLQTGMQVAQAGMQGAMPPEQALEAVRAIGQHAAEHLQQVKDNPTRRNEYDGLRKQLGTLGGAADQLQQRVQEASQHQDQQQQLSEDGQIKLIATQNQEHVRNVKAQGNEQRAWRKTLFQERIKDATTAADIRRKQLALPAGSK